MQGLKKCFLNGFQTSGRAPTRKCMKECSVFLVWALLEVQNQFRKQLSYNVLYKYYNKKKNLKDFAKKKGQMALQWDVLDIKLFFPLIFLRRKNNLDKCRSRSCANLQQFK